MKVRNNARNTIRSSKFDVCVIGGGATGLGCALDAQLRGKRTLLVDAGDFVSQTSSASTKLVHGGVRYLQQAVASLDYGQFRMVSKALHERIHMLQAAPFLARPLELLVPCFSAWERMYFGIGMKAYDAIAGKASIFPSRILSRKEALDRLPALRRDGLAGAVSYADGQFDDARYGLTLAQSFSRAGGELLNYARVVELRRDTRGKLNGVLVEDVLTGERLSVAARAVLNCTGPFADHIRHMANPSLPARLRLSKGIHVLLPVEPMQSDAALLIPKTEDGRVIFAIPWFGSLLVGTTEDEVADDVEIAANGEEIAYLLKYINRCLDTNFTPADVEATFAGVRPLVASADSVNTKKLIRDHEVEVDRESGLVSVLGGKWTTYRAMAEDGVDAALRVLGDTPVATKTLHYALDGAEGYHADYWRQLAGRHGITERTAQHLAEKFGVRADDVLALIASDPGLAAPLCAGASAIAAEVVYCVREEMAQTIADVLARRIGIQFHNWKQARAAAPAVGNRMAAELGWTPSKTAQAIAEYQANIDRLRDLAGLPLDANLPPETEPETDSDSTGEEYVRLHRSH